MSYGVTIEVTGKYACFSRPELSVERMSYDCITPSAARGILESVYWHPPMRYHIDRIHVLSPIKFTTIRTNEVKSKANVRALYDAAIGKKAVPHLDASQDRTQRTSRVLVDVRYLIESHFTLDEKRLGPGDTAAKFDSILHRRLSKGQCFSQPYLGLRQFAAAVRLAEGHSVTDGAYANTPEIDFGLMLYDMDYSDPKEIKPMFFRAVMRNGVIDVAGSEVYR